MANAESRLPLIPIDDPNAPFPQLSQVIMAPFVDVVRTWVPQEQGVILNQVGYYANKPIGSYGVAFRVPIMGMPFEMKWSRKFGDNPTLRTRTSRRSTATPRGRSASRSRSDSETRITPMIKLLVAVLVAAAVSPAWSQEAVKVVRQSRCRTAAC